MLYYCIVRLQPFAGLIYSALLLTTNTHDAAWFPKSCSQWYGWVGFKTKTETATFGKKQTET